MHKRLHDEYDASQVENKRFKTTTSNVVDELLCPITQKLPADPVTAEDGRLYERAAIEEWFEKQNVVQKKGKGEVSVRSPSTNKHMGLDLTDAVQIRITIQHLVQSGLVDDDKAAAVKEQLAVEKAANDGNGDALYEMGRQFQAKVLRDTDEEDGFWLYEQLSDGQNHWWVKGARLHNPKCMAAYGQFLYWGLQ